MISWVVVIWELITPLPHSTNTTTTTTVIKIRVPPIRSCDFQMVSVESELSLRQIKFYKILNWNIVFLNFSFQLHILMNNKSTKVWKVHRTSLPWWASNSSEALSSVDFTKLWNMEKAFPSTYDDCPTTRILPMLPSVTKNSTCSTLAQNGFPLEDLESDRVWTSTDLLMQHITIRCNLTGDYI